MDPFSTVGLVASIVTFIETGVKIISVVKELKGRDGATAENQRAEFLAAHMKAFGGGSVAPKRCHEYPRRSEAHGAHSRMPMPGQGPPGVTA